MFRLFIDRLINIIDSVRGELIIFQRHQTQFIDNMILGEDCEQGSATLGAQTLYESRISRCYGPRSWLDINTALRSAYGEDEWQ